MVMFIFNYIFKSLVSWVMSYVLYALGVLYITEKASAEFGYDLDFFDMFRGQIMSGIDLAKGFAEGQVKDQIKSTTGVSLFGKYSGTIPSVPKTVKQMTNMSSDNLRDSLAHDPDSFQKLANLGGQYNRSR